MSLNANSPMNRDKYWLIGFVGTNGGNLAPTQIHIFDVPSCTLTWVIKMSRFDFNNMNGSNFKYLRFYCCSHGIVLVRTGMQYYGTNNSRSEADFALHPVPFWDHEQIRKLLRPHVVFVSELVDIIMSYSGSPSIENEEITSHLRYIQSNALAQSDGLEAFVVMASYWDKQQLERMGQTLRKSESGKIGEMRHLIFRSSWDQLLRHQHPPSAVNTPFRAPHEWNPFDDDTLVERGTYLHLAHQFYDQ